MVLLDFSVALGTIDHDFSGQERLGWNLEALFYSDLSSFWRAEKMMLGKSFFDILATDLLHHSGVCLATNI